MIKGVIFDLDGVITDTAEYHYLAWKALADKNSLHFNREINEKLRGVSRITSLDIILSENNIVFEKKDIMSMAEEKNSIYVELINQMTSCDLFKGIDELISSLKKSKIKIALGSASKNANLVLEKLDIKESFDIIGDGYSVNKSKPAPDLFLFVASKLGLEPKDCLVIEDAEAGIKAAKAAGMKVIGIGIGQRIKEADLCYLETGDIELEKVINF